MAAETKVQMTEEQEQVTKARDRDILVSAAAGSGKTWVLVQRILCRMEQEELDISRFLIVTFTKAAAAEMRERIGAAIQQRLNGMDSREEESKREFWHRQATLVYQAQISTIDSFCADIVRQYFMKLCVEPNYRIAEEAELSILRGEVMEQLLEQEYEQGEERFLHFVECYAPGRDDKKIETLIWQLHQFQIAHPDPDAWIADSIRLLNDSEIWYEIVLEHCEALLESVLTQVGDAMDYAREHGGDDKIMATLQSDLDYFEELFAACQNKDYDQVFRRVKAHEKYAVLYKKSMEKEEGEQLRQQREAYKELVKKQIEQRYFQIDREVLEQERQIVIPDMEELLSLSVKFRKAYEKAKREQAIADFSDVEHMALAILTQKQEDGSFAPSDVAEKLSQEYAEIMVDEYQDSNYLQEAILSSVARNNMFMVGDMKQSIYRFRMARPELFVGKYKEFASFSGNDQEEQRVKIELDRNFRSSENVLESINYIFYHIMKERIGGVEYDKKAALKAGASFPAPQLNKEGELAEEYVYDHDTELLLYDGEEEKDMENAGEEGGEKTELLREEARMIAAKIKDMMNPDHPMLVRDTHLPGPDARQYRPVTYRDIVILLRSPSSGAETLQQVLNDAGIPSFLESSKGYFSTTEVQTILSYLKALNNGTEDIAVTSVLRNYFGDCSAEDLAQLVCDTREEKNACILERVRLWCGKEESREQNPGLYSRLCHFLQEYDRYVQCARELSVGDLIELIYEDSGYLDYVSALPAGERRVANLMMLVQKANAYEKTNFRGLFQFVRYIEQLRQYEVDFGEANLLSENDDVVRILSIHKSKGLEFPVVFVAQLAKTFNEADLRSDVLLHADLGVGPNVIDSVLRTRHKTIMRDVLTLLSRKDMLGEELRVLYVALTRAKDKCILSASVKNWGEYLAKIPIHDGYAAVYSGKSYLQWIVMALCHHSVLQEQYRSFGLEVPQYDEHRFPKAAFSFERMTKKELQEQEITGEVNRMWKEEELQRAAAKIPKEQVEQLEERLKTSYSWEAFVNQPGKYSVSQLKEHRMQQIWEEEEEENPFPSQFEKKEPGGVTGAERGTYIHKFMELYDFTKDFSKQEYERVCSVMEQRRMPEIWQALPVEMVSHFFESRLAQEMVQAAKRQKLKKEAQFVVGFPAAEVMEDMGVILQGESKDRVLVQGIIDAYYETEDGALVIMDYKTDRVTAPEKLKERYRMQLAYYKKTLEQLTGKTVKNCVLYSFFLGEEIVLE